MRVIDLRGQEGNAFVLLGYAQTWGKQLGLNTDSILEDMRAGDYNHLLDVFERWFSGVCVLEGKPPYDDDIEDEWD